MLVLITFIYCYLPVHAKNGIALLPCIFELSVCLHVLGHINIEPLSFFKEINESVSFINQKQF